MRAVIQRVSRAQVEVGGAVVGTVSRGLLVFIGIQEMDTESDLEWLVEKIRKVRIFEDEDGKMNQSVEAVRGGILVISQFTLFGNLKKGTRPSFNRAAAPPVAEALYRNLVDRLSEYPNLSVAAGRFGEHMDIDCSQDGPVTLILDTHDRRF